MRHTVKNTSTQKIPNISILNNSANKVGTNTIVVENLAPELSILSSGTKSNIVICLKYLASPNME
jgi:hypothetical protein